jgi:hypothetical protein
MKKIHLLIMSSMAIVLVLTCITCKPTSNAPGGLDENIKIVQDTVIVRTDTSRVNILEYQPTTKTSLIFRNNTISAQNINNHIVLFGTEAPGASDTNLDNVQITGNKLTYTRTDSTYVSSTEGVLVGYSINATIKYNRLIDCPNGTPVKSSGMTYTSGGIAYNVYSGLFRVGAATKGTSGIKFYNNTFYNTRRNPQSVVGSVYITANYDTGVRGASASNCEIYNNIFYTKYQVSNIYCDSASLTNLKCDYNLYYCESGEPVFTIAGKVITLTEWKAMGFDTHSLVMNPNFTDFNSLIPTVALNYGMNLGAEWSEGLASSTVFGRPPVTKSQGTNWQVGAFIVSPLTGINDISSDKNEYAFSAFPNPVKDILNMVFKNKLIKNYLNLYGMNGNILLSSVVTGDYTIDFNHYPPGLYFLRIKNESDSKTFKIIKE